MSSRHRRRRESPEQSGGDNAVAASYARVSSGKQREESIDDQERKNRDRAAANGHIIADKHCFSDYGVSGTKKVRGGLTAMEEAAANGEFKTLYVYNLARLARESILTMPMLKRLVYVHRVRVISVTESIDTDRGGWEVVAAIFSAISERFLKDLSESVFRGQEGNVINGFAVGDHCFGYTTREVEGTENTRPGRNAKPRKVYEIDPLQAAWVVCIFDWFVHKRKSIGWIVRELNRQNAPKDHRSTTPEWHHQLVVNLLQREKYIGVWPWGEKKNIRNPETGDIRQECRPQAEWEKNTRLLPQLRIIDDSTFEAAQQRLEQNREKYAKSRDAEGHLIGSTDGNNGRKSKRVLNGLCICGCCNASFRSEGKRMRCRAAKRGTRDCKLSVTTELCEQRILDAIGREVLQNADWVGATYDALLNAFDEFVATVPSAISDAEAELTQLNNRIERLIDAVEVEGAGVDLNERLNARIAERRELEEKLRRLKEESNGTVRRPTREWLREELGKLSCVLKGEASVANEALRVLLVDSIVVNKAEHDRQRGPVTYAKLKLSVASVAAAVGQVALSDNPQEFHEIVVDLDEKSKESRQAEIAMDLYKAGKPNFEIAEALGVSRSRVTAILKSAFKARGETLPDGRSRRSALQRKHREKPLYQRIAAKVMPQYEAGALLGEIASSLNVDRDTVTKAVKYWYQSRGLHAPDGRTRRKSLQKESSGAA